MYTGIQLCLQVFFKHRQIQFIICCKRCKQCWENTFPFKLHKKISANLRAEIYKERIICVINAIYKASTFFWTEVADGKKVVGLHKPSFCKTNDAFLNQMVDKFHEIF